MIRPAIGLLSAACVFLIAPGHLPSALCPRPFVFCPALHAQDPPSSQQRPVFRAGTHYVRVDAYPTKDGEIVRGLTADDFALLEDGKPQAIDAVQFVQFPEWTPLAERRDPNSMREMYRLAADPTYRVFVLYFDTHHVSNPWDLRFAAPAAAQMLDRMLGARDLVGVLTSRGRAGDLTLGQRPPAFERELMRIANLGPDLDPVEAQLRACDAEAAIARYRLDDVFGDLEGLVVVLNAMREERKNIIVFSDGWALPGPSSGLAARRGPSGPPRIGVGRGGTLTTGATQPFEVTSRWCDEQVSYLAGIDFYRRWRDLTLAARQKNVAFYPVSPGGVWAYDLMSDRTSYLLSLASETDGLSVAGTNDLATGLRKVTEDLSAYYLLGYYTSNEVWDGRTRQIEVRLSPTGERVRARRQYVAPTEEEMAMSRAALEASPKPAPGVSAVDLALEELARIGRGNDLFARASPGPDGLRVVAELGSGLASSDRWRQGADVAVEVRHAEGEAVLAASGRIAAGTRSTVVEAGAPVGAGPWRVTVRAAGARGPAADPVELLVAGAAWPDPPAVFRASGGPRAPFQPAAELLFRRTERVHLEWRLPAGTRATGARLLRPNGDALDVPVTLAVEADVAGTRVTANVVLAPIAAGDYVLELELNQGIRNARSAVAIRVVR